MVCCLTQLIVLIKLQILQSSFLAAAAHAVCCVGGVGPTSDFGWGCMLRCGQMMLAEALIRRHLSRGTAHLL